MSVSIRLKRSGRRHLPFYHIGVFTTLSRRDGRPIEQLGFYDPASNTKEEVRLDVERARYWLEQGAKPSETVASILRKQGLTGDLWRKKASKGKKKAEGVAQKKLDQKKDRSVKARKKGRTANSKARAEKKKSA